MVRKKLPKNEKEKGEREEDKKLVTKINERQAVRAEKRDTELPPFPPPKKGEDISTGLQTEESEEIEEESDFEPIDIEEFCQDMVGAIGEGVHILIPKVSCLDSKQKKLVGKPLAKVLVKYKVDKICKDELLLVGALSIVGYQKFQEYKKGGEVKKK